MHTEKKRDEIAGMFDRIAWRYDFLNRFLSFGTDKRWRKKAVSVIGELIKPVDILDVATGTADLAIESLKLNPEKVTGIDISAKMLDEGRKKIEQKGLTGRIDLLLAPSEEIPFGEYSFDVAMAAFGARNFSDTGRGLSEMYRVLRNNGVIMILEFSKPQSFPFKQVYALYFNKVLPFVGKLFSRDYSAYRYLPDSVEAFPEGEAFLQLLGRAGFGYLRMKRLTGGIATIYTGIKNTMQ